MSLIKKIMMAVNKHKNKTKKKTIKHTLSIDTLAKSLCETAISINKEVRITAKQNLESTLNQGTSPLTSKTNGYFDSLESAILENNQDEIQKSIDKLRVDFAKNRKAEPEPNKLKTIKVEYPRQLNGEIVSSVEEIPLAAIIGSNQVSLSHITFRFNAIFIRSDEDEILIELPKGHFNKDINDNNEISQQQTEIELTFSGYEQPDEVNRTAASIKTQGEYALAENTNTPYITP